MAGRKFWPGSARRARKRADQVRVPQGTVPWNGPIPNQGAPGAPFARQPPPTAGGPWTPPPGPGLVAPGQGNRYPVRPSWPPDPSPQRPPRLTSFPPPSAFQGTARDREHPPDTHAGRQGDTDRVRPFDVVSAHPRQAWWVRVRRLLVITATVVLMITGGVSIATQVRQWLRAETPVSSVGVSDTELDGAAEVAATDYLAWDASAKPRRQAALRRVMVPGTTADGWDGQGRQWADSAIAISQTRLSADRAVVDVRVRVIGFTASGTPSSPAPTASSSPTGTQSPGVTSQESGDVGSAPDVTAPGWTARAPRWLTIAVPLKVVDGRPMVTAPPALIGPTHSDDSASDTAVATTANDDAFAESTKDTASTFLQKFASGELDFVRAPRAAITGLGGAVGFGELVRWRVVKSVDGANASERVGIATVTWVLPGDGAGKLTCTYRVTLRRHEDRWLLAAIEAETEIEK